jgi:D-alanyl-lipoteichoic acid acyltransferase DltB (MBOAT superfamily)
MFFSIALIAWIGGSLASIANGNRRLPSVVLLLGLVFVVLTFMGRAGYFDVAGIAVLAAIIWIANDMETKNAEWTIKAKAACCVAVAFVILGFGLVFFLTNLKPRLITFGLETKDYGVWEAFREIPFFLSPLLSVILLMVAMRLWKQLRESQHRNK